MTELLVSLPEELLSHILSFLPWQDILRCTTLCKALRQTYLSSSELQYITEMGGQQLLPVFINHRIPFSKRLQLLRDKSHAWSKFDTHSFEIIYIPVPFHTRVTVSIVSGHACFWKPTMHSSKIFPIVPKPLQQTIERDFSPDSLCSLPKQNQSDFDVLNVLMDPVQNLIAIVYATVIRNGGLVYDKGYYIDLVALDGDCTHPQAAGRTLFLSNLPTRSDFITKSTKIEGLGRHIALRLFDGDQPPIPSFASRWWLQIWDWQHSTTSNCILGGPILDPDFDEIDICFLGHDRFLVSNDDLKLYSIEDMSRAPLLLTRFLLPSSAVNLRCFTLTDDIARSSHPQMHAPQVAWISDPKHRLISLITWDSELYFIISTRIFFELDFVNSERIPWESWGPLNARIFPHQSSCKLGVSGSRALYAFTVGVEESDDGLIEIEYRLHLMDFSPLAIARIAMKIWPACRQTTDML
ncbi:uncharacterized protein EDB93DRAFT_1270125 [Suillus bovinus]|uniref:uncharacterized protein n=1 Tax=Suillus bovinus TaxID=48563 RepID=UPI001B8732C5|nr:uncharacterized protein EDB93DRAFT_1270125 [Suillus bovinus]KAG2127608.1 hypothetical protein EDB93DRAFT_1270125 [Suillus bovinus]